MIISTFYVLESVGYKFVLIDSFIRESFDFLHVDEDCADVKAELTKSIVASAVDLLFTSFIGHDKDWEVSSCSYVGCFSRSKVFA